MLSDIFAKLQQGEKISADEQQALRSAPGLRYTRGASTYGAGDGEGDGYEGGTVSDSGDKSSIGAIGGQLASASGNGFPGISTASGIVDSAISSSYSPMAKGLMSDALGVLGVPGSAINTGISLASSSNPAQTASQMGLGIFGSLVGGSVGPLGAMVGNFAGSALGNAAYGSFKDGYLGDAIDSRSHESYRDTLEDAGMTRSEVQNRAEQLADAESRSRDASYGPSRSKSAPDPGKFGGSNAFGGYSSDKSSANIGRMGGTSDGYGGASVGTVGRDSGAYGTRGDNDTGGAPTGDGRASVGSVAGATERGDISLGDAAAQGWGDLGGGNNGDGGFGNMGGDMDGTGNGGTGGVMA